MSHSSNPPDTQALLQSMLQRLKLQPGRENQAHLHTHVPITAASTWGRGGERGASDLQKVNNSPANCFEFGTYCADGNVGEIQQPGHDFEMDRGLVSFSTQKNSTNGDTGENRVLGQAAQPGINPTGTGQLFPAKSLKDADITSFKMTDGKRVSLGSSAMSSHIPSNKDAVTNMGQNQDQEQSFPHKVYTWSLKPTDANLDVRSQENEVVHVGNGGFGALAQSKDMQIVPTGQETTNSSSRRKQRSSENKTRRWTQKIKERWKDRQGNFGKKGKGQKEDQKIEQGTTPLTEENLFNASNKEEERTLPSLHSSDSSKTPPTHFEDGTIQGHTRSASDFEFGLGSFSLLEEIVTGQEWAKFLNPNQSVTSANQRPSEEQLSQFNIPPNPNDSGQSSVILNQQGGVNNQWSFKGTEASAVSNFSMAQISPAFRPVGMDITEEKQAGIQDDQSEPMEHGHTRRPPSFGKPANFAINSAPKSRLQINRKRQHQSAERLQTEDISDERPSSSLSLTSSHVMKETGESHHDKVMPLYPLNSSPPPLSSSPSTPFAPVPRGVLKHSISQNSREFPESSMEIMTKRRRVEENRRVHFLEEVETIALPELDLELTDSEEDSGADEDSVIEQEFEEEQAAIEVVAPTRRTGLPAWILALKKRNTGRKHK